MLDDYDRLIARVDSARPTKRKALVGESHIEADHIAGIAAQGGTSYKFVSPARRSVPDRLDLLPVPERDRHVVAQYVRFTECKRPGQVPTPSQLREHERLRALGFRVDVVDQKRNVK